MKAVVAAINQEKALVGAFSVIVQPVVEPMDRFTALIVSLHGRGDDDAVRQVALGLEPHHVRAVLDDLDLAVHVDVSVLALHRPVHEPRLQLEGAVGRLVAVGVGTIFIQPGNIVTIRS